MHEREPVAKQRAAPLVEQRQHVTQVLLVLRPRRLRLEEEHDLGPRVRDAVRGVLDQLAVGEADPRVAAADPLSVGRRLAEDVDAPGVCVALETPGLVGVRQPPARLRERGHLAVAHRVQLELRQCRRHLAEALGRDGDLEVLVLAQLTAGEEVDRPAPGHVPGQRKAP